MTNHDKIVLEVSAVEAVLLMRALGDSIVRLSGRWEDCSDYRALRQYIYECARRDRGPYVAVVEQLERRGEV